MLNHSAGKQYQSLDVKRRIHHPSPSYRCDVHWKSMITWSKLHLYTSCPILGCLSWCPTSIAVVATIPTFNIKNFSMGFNHFTPSCFAEPDLRRRIQQVVCKYYPSDLQPFSFVWLTTKLCSMWYHSVNTFGGGTPQPYDETSEFKHL